MRAAAVLGEKKLSALTSKSEARSRDLLAEGGNELEAFQFLSATRRRGDGDGWQFDFLAGTKFCVRSNSIQAGHFVDI